MDSFAALPHGHPMVVFMEFDVTGPQDRIEALQQGGVRVSLFCHVLRGLAVSLAEHPELNAIRHGRRVAYFEDVDVNVPVEVSTADDGGPAARFALRFGALVEGTAGLEALAPSAASTSSSPPSGSAVAS